MRMTRINIALGAVMALLVGATWVVAHDSWVQTNTNLVRVGDVVFFDLMLGNHGNEHRDFRLAGKVDLASSRLELIEPDGSRHDLEPSLVDQGMAPKEGYWAGRFRTSKPGVHMIVQTSEQVVSYAPKRSIKSAKTFFLASRSLDQVPHDAGGYDRVLGHGLELVPLTNPVTPMGPGSAIRVQLLRNGRPLANATISFIPRGQTLKEGFDEKYQRKTDADGIASFEPDDANYFLIVAHHDDDTEKGSGYDSTKYSATLTVYVPAICPCCPE
ncbi:DUF4198 domain-containing protein [Fontivita pretiosa]|uniref:DUF4198 domain-containing protein n=1 Tax=Fontivita pretiosa TaxID=2989684 RepID=UPI003D170039